MSAECEEMGGASCGFAVGAMRNEVPAVVGQGVLVGVCQLSVWDGLGRKCAKEWCRVHRGTV